MLKYCLNIFESMFMKEKEIIYNIADNIAKKLEIYMYQNKLNIHNLSGIIGVDKQPVYRLIKRNHVPNVEMLYNIAKFLGCNTSELLDSRFFMNIDIYDNLSLSNKINNYKMFFNDDNFIKIYHYEFYGILCDNMIEVFHKCNEVKSDGLFLYKNNNNIEKLNIISFGSKLVIAIIDNKEIRININNYKIVSKLYKNLSILNSEEYVRCLNNVIATKKNY